MTLTVKHNFVSPIADQGDPTLLGPDEWNDTHALLMATARLLGRATAGAGTVEEITLGTGLSFSGTVLNASGGGGGSMITIGAEPGSPNVGDYWIDLSGNAYIRVAAVATLDPARTNAGITLSGGNLVATKIGASEEATSFSNSSLSSGKSVFQLTVNAEVNPGAEVVAVGVGNASEVLNSYLGVAGNNSVGWFDDGAVYINDTVLFTIQTFGPGDVLTIAVDRDASLIWFRTNSGDWNDNGAADPVTGTGGIDVSAVTGALFAGLTLYTATDEMTANFAPGLGLTGFTDWPSGSWVFIEQFGGSLVVGTTTISGGTPGYRLSDNNGVLGEEPTRIKLIANLILYVRADGADTAGHTGLANTSGDAFLTMSYAYARLVQDYDLAGFQVTITLGDGSATWAEAIDIAFAGWAGGGEIRFDWQNAVLDISGNTLFKIGVGVVLSGPITVRNVVFGGAGTVGTALRNDGIGVLQIGGGVVFDVVTSAHILANGVDARIVASGSYTIQGGASYHMRADIGSEIFNDRSPNATVTGTPAFFLFAFADNQSLIYSVNGYTGGATGKRYEVDHLSQIYTGGAGANYFPGSTAGSVDATSIYT